MNRLPDPQPAWSRKFQAVASILGTDPERGLDASRVGELLERWGPNRIKRESRFSRVKTLAHQFASPLIFILILAVGVTVFLHEWIDSVIIALAIIINAFLGFFQENKAEKALLSLRSYLKDSARVIRGGREFEIDPTQIVPGDLIRLAPGVLVPADARLVKINNLQVDEAILTGESLPVSKRAITLPEETTLAERRNMVFGGTLVVEGYATAMVVTTGVRTQIGKIADLVSSTEREKTPIQKAVSRLAWIIAATVSVLVIIIFSLGIGRGESYFDMFIISVAVAVGAIPEALPIGLTAILAVGVEQLAKRKGIVRNLSAAETLGSTTVIMTDKTGTLTEAKMELVDIFTTDDLLGEELPQAAKFNEARKDVLTIAVVNTDVLISEKGRNVDDWQFTGSSLETNLVRSSVKKGIDPRREREEGKFQLLIPFNSKNKYSVSGGYVTLKAGLAGRKNGLAHITLGAPDILLKHSELKENDRAKLLERLNELSQSGKRILGVGLKFIDPDLDLPPEVIKGLSLLGFLVFYDPVRKTVPAAVENIERHGVRVVVATGDLKGTAMSVVRELGWRIEDKEVLTGEELEEMTDEVLILALRTVRVFARVTPRDKLRIAKLFQKRGEVVAMTGDGVNDAPALKVTDIGIAIGSGNDVAKGVADLILLDDNFETIVAAIEEGKKMLRNIRKTFTYLMSNSFDEVILIGGSLIAGLAMPLTAAQIIWVNLFTGSLPAIAFAFDQTPSVGGVRPVSDKKILNREVKFLSLGIGTLSSLLLFVLYWLLVKWDLPVEVSRTFLFACFSSYILFVAFSLKNLERPIYSYNPFSNRFLVLSVAIGLLFLTLTIYTPLFQNIFQTVPLGPIWLAWLAVWVIANLLIVEVAKWLFYRKSKVKPSWIRPQLLRIDSYPQ